MIKTDCLQLLPSRYFIGTAIEIDRFIHSNKLTPRQANVLSLSCRNPVYIAYSINSITSNCKNERNIEIHFLLLDICSMMYRADYLETLASAVQRGIPYQLVLILRHRDNYRIVMPISRPTKKRPDVQMVDELYLNEWRSFDELKSELSSIRDILDVSDNDISFVTGFFKRYLIKYEVYIQQVELSREENELTNTVLTLIDTFGTEKLYEMLCSIYYYEMVSEHSFYYYVFNDINKSENDSLDEYIYEITDTEDNAAQICGLMYQVERELDYTACFQSDEEKFEYLESTYMVLRKHLMKKTIAVFYDLCEEFYDLSSDSN